MKKIFTLCVSMTCLYATHAQSYFEKALQVPDPEYAWSLTPTAGNKTVVLAGDARSQSSTPQAFIGEFGAGGNLLWNKTFVFSGETGGATGAIKTADSGYALITYSGYFVKLTASHSIQFIKKLTITGNKAVTATSGLLQTAAGGYVFAGVYGTRADAPSNDIYLCRLDSAGTFLWAKKVLDNGQVNRIKPTAAGGFLIAGASTVSDPNSDMAVIKTDSLGNVIFSSVVGDSFEDIGTDVAETSDGGCLLVGGTASLPYLLGSYLAKYSASGVLEWTKSMKLPGYAFRCVAVLTDRQNTSTILSVGTNDTDYYNSYQYLLNVSNNGTENRSVVSKFAGDAASGYFSAATRGTGNSIWLASPARTTSNTGIFLVAKTTATGISCNQDTLPLSPVANVGAAHAINTAAVALSGQTATAQYQSTGSVGTVSSICSPQNPAADAVMATTMTKPGVAIAPGLSLFPNPAASVIRISGLPVATRSQLILVDAMGKTISAVVVTSSSYNWNIAGLTRGMYYIRVLQADGGKHTLRFVKE